LLSSPSTVLGGAIKTLNLPEAISESIKALADSGEPASLTAVCQTLGIAAAPTLQHDGGTTLRVDVGGLVSLGRFQLLGELGRGGMGRVLEARDPEIRRSVAVKVVIDPSRVTEVQLARFVAEAQVTGQLQHPNIVPVHDIGVSEEGQFYFVMKKVEGRSLREVITALRAGHEATLAAFPQTKLLVAFIQVCNAVAYAHDRGVLHRDIKPDNIMLGPFGEVLLLDWGVARLMNDSTEVFTSEALDKLTISKTLDGTTIGTPGFMSPEQARGDLQLLDGRSDVWSLGAVLYELLTLQPAYSASNLLELVFASANGPPQDPRQRAPERQIPEELAELCLRAMSTEREERLPTAAALRSAVETYLEGSKRREQAQQLVIEAEALLPDIAALHERAAVLTTESKMLLADVQSWEPEERKLAGWAKADEGRVLQRKAENMDLQHEQGLQSALRLFPSLPEAHAALAEYYRSAHEQAEKARDSEAILRQAHFLEAHAEALPEGHPVRRKCAVYVKGDGALTLLTNPPSAEVLLHRYELHNRRLVPRFVRSLGRTPLVRVSLPMGSYLCVLRSEGRPDVFYPVHIERSAHWDGLPPEGDEPVSIWLPDPGKLDRDDCYVPAGWFTAGGDPEAPESLSRRRVWLDDFVLRRYPVTNQDYVEFLDDLVAQGREEEALLHAPRERASTPGAQGALIYSYEGGRFGLRVDLQGDLWQPKWPVMMVDWFGAAAFAAWKAAGTGQDWRLPHELEWEKAARGVDGRLFPWGDGFDPSWCHMKESHPGVPNPAEVGSYPIDESVYGVRDLAGNTRDWTVPTSVADGKAGDREPLLDPLGSYESSSQRVLRGGSWYLFGSDLSVANRFSTRPERRNGSAGFRLARTLS